MWWGIIRRRSALRRPDRRLPRVFASGNLQRPTWLTFSPPEAPSDLIALGSGSQVRLSWTDNSDDETGFEIERKIGTGSFVVIGTVGANVTTFIDRPLPRRTALIPGPSGRTDWPLGFLQ